MSARAGVVVWLTGLPSSGKSSLARRVLESLQAANIGACMLDGDAVRAALHPSPGYTDEARRDFYTTLAELAALLARQGLAVLVPATANRAAFRAAARELAPRFIEVFVDVPLATCIARDAKGLYAQARHGEVEELPGLGQSYEAPTAPDVIARGGRDVEACERITRLVSSR